jgi:lipopolysaccharide/colanic/teichoic acid biosynthesis glycosyltransferase
VANRASTLYARGGKRLLDLALVVAATPLLVPAAALTALAVGLFLGRPLFFVQERPGLNGRSFRLIKFRTMTEERDEAGALLTDNARMTPFGRWLRRSSLDELPELWKVITGEMSLVGPRPLLTAYLERYDERQSRRHEVRPGITGWAQVNGRNTVDWQKKLELDIWYIEHLSLALDLGILARTVAVVLGGGGINAAGHSTMPEFEGNERDRA